jgi:ethanolamine utilization protein EutN
MIVGIVIGEVTATIKHPFYGGRKLLIVARCDPAGQPTADYVIAVDTVGAGRGETVLVNDEGNGARQVLANADGPVRSVIVGIIDRTDP